MQQRDDDLLEGWQAAERGDARDASRSAAWQQGFDLKMTQQAERKRFRTYAHQPLALQ